MPDVDDLTGAVNGCVRLGFERTLEQDVAFGIRQLIDIASKALSSAINDPYTAVQAIDHLTGICVELAVRPLGAEELAGPAGRGLVVVPANTFDDYLSFICALVGRYGAKDVTVMQALLRLLRSCAAVLPEGSTRLGSVARQVDVVLADAEREMVRPDDLRAFRQSTESLQRSLQRRTDGERDPR